MTPLAHLITKQLTLPVKERRILDQCGILKKMDDVHCFECSEVIDAANGILESAWDAAKGPNSHAVKQMLADSGFLPASKTWIEWRCPDEGYRVGFLLMDGGASFSATVLHAFGGDDVCAVGTAAGALRVPLMLGVNDAVIDLGLKEYEGQQQFSWMLLLIVLLAFINTPRVVGRRQHMPHRRLERDLVRARPMIGKFPLHAWTEIKLEISAPGDASGDPSVEAHYTGDRALHFCRAHIRIRLGKLEIVRGHWRGDPALGIRQSRYRLVGAA